MCACVCLCVRVCACVSVCTGVKPPYRGGVVAGDGHQKSTSPAEGRESQSLAGEVLQTLDREGLQDINAGITRTHRHTHIPRPGRTDTHKRARTDTQAGTPHRQTGTHAAQTQAGRQAGTPHRRRQAQAGTDTQTHARTLAHLNSLHREGLKDRDAGRTHAHTLTHCSTLSSYQAKGRFFLPPHWSFSLSLDLPT